MPCILRLNLQWYHILIILPANSMATQLQNLWIFYSIIYCCNLSGGVALIVWFITNGMCVKNNTIMYVARTSNNRVISSGDLYSCLLPRCEALRTCRSGFPIAIVSTDTTWRNTHACDVKHHFGDVYEILPNSTHPQLHFTVLGFLKLASERKHISLMLASEKRRFLQWQAQGQQNP